MLGIVEHQGGRWYYSNGTGAENLQLCTTANIQAFAMCKDKIIKDFVNITAQLVSALKATKNATKIDLLRDDFWCVSAAFKIQLLGTCVNPCRTQQTQAQLNQMYSQAGQENAIQFCETGMNVTNTASPGFNDILNLETILSNKNCPQKCADLVNSGLNARLLGFQAAQASSGIVHSISILLTTFLFFVTTSLAFT